MMKKRLFMALLAAASAFVMTSCGNDKDDDPKPEISEVPTEATYTETENSVSCQYPIITDTQSFAYIYTYKFDADTVCESTVTVICESVAMATAAKAEFDPATDDDILDVKQNGNTIVVYYAVKETIKKQYAIIGMRALATGYGCTGVPSDDSEISAEATYTETENSVSCQYPNSKDEPTASYVFSYMFDGDKVTEYTTTIECQSAVVASAIYAEFEEDANSNIKSLTQNLNTVIVSYNVPEDLTKSGAITAIRALAKSKGCEGVPAE